MKPHGLEPNNGARHRIDGMSRRKDTSPFSGMVCPVTDDPWVWFADFHSVCNWRIAMEPRCSPGRRGEQVEWGWVENRVSTGSLRGRWATAVSPDLSELPFLLSFIQGWRLVKTQGASQWASRPTAQASAAVLPYKRTLALEEKRAENSVLLSRQGCSSGCPRGH